MRSLGQKILLVATLPAAAVPCSLSGTVENGIPRSDTIYVRIYDYADVPAHILRQAKGHAAGIFERVGIRVVWLDDPLNVGASDRQVSARMPLRHVRRFCELAIRIYPAKMSRRLEIDTTVVGYALLPERDTGLGRIAIVFDDRARALAKKGFASRSVTLGHIIAHEIGHLLLGPRSHSRYGIMSVPWNRAILKRAATGRLNFTGEEVQKMRASLATRTRLAVVRAATITN